MSTRKDERLDRRRNRIPRPERINRIGFRDRLLDVMEQKVHWAGSAFAGMVPKENMEYHFRDEYTVFVKAFPEYLRGALLQNPPQEVAKDLQENIEEEELGMHYAGKPHPELFLKIPEAFGFDTSTFDTRALAPRAQAYRDFLLDATHNRGWESAVAVSTLFLEGNRHERSVFHKEFGITPWRGLPLEQHPLVTGYGIPTEALELVNVHHELDNTDGEHRLAAWRMILDHIPASKRPSVLASMNEALAFWKAWRDEVAETCGIEQDGAGNPRRKTLAS